MDAMVLPRSTVNTRRELQIIIIILIEECMNCATLPRAQPTVKPHALGSVQQNSSCVVAVLCSCSGGKCKYCCCIYCIDRSCLRSNLWAVASYVARQLQEIAKDLQHSLRNSNATIDIGSFQVSLTLLLFH